MALLRITCPECQFPGMEPQKGARQYTHGDTSILVAGVEFCVCPQCQHRLTLDQQMKRNRDRATVAIMEAQAAEWSGTRAFGWPADADGTTR